MISEGGGPDPAEAAEIEALEVTWPRAMIAEGIARPLTLMWVESRRRAIRQGHPAFARHPMNDSIAEGLFHARRARRLVRGIEGAQASLAAQEDGLKKVEATRGSGSIRISRLLVVSADGSPRFFRQVEKVQTLFARRIVVLVLECDEEELGAAAFGPGKKARALLIDHKEAVIRFLKCLDPGLRTDASSTSS